MNKRAHARFIGKVPNLAERFVMADDILLSIGVKDIAGKSKRVPVFFPSTTTVAQITGWLADAAVALNAFLDGYITDAEVTLPVALPGGLATGATAGSTVRRGALFGFENPTRFAWDQYVPAIDLDVIVGTSVDPEATGVEDWLAAMVAGITVSSVLIRPTNGSGELLTNVLTSEETFRK